MKKALFSGFLFLQTLLCLSISIGIQAQEIVLSTGQGMEFGKGGLFTVDLQTNQVDSFPLPAIKGASPGKQCIIEYSPGKYFGMLQSDGSNGAQDKGLLFTYNSLTEEYRRVHFFTGPDGEIPYSGLVFASQTNTIYGSTSKGGVFNKGVIFKFDIPSLTYQKTYDFGSTANDLEGGAESMIISGSLIYGISKKGGTDNGGGLFKISLTGNLNYQILAHTAPAGYPTPLGKVLVLNSKVWFLSGGIQTNAALCQYDLVSNTLSTPVVFNGLVTGIYPEDITIKGDALYGVCRAPFGNLDTRIFKYDLPTATISEFTTLGGQFTGNALGIIYDQLNGFYLSINSSTVSGAFVHVNCSTKLIEYVETTSDLGYGHTGGLLLTSDGDIVFATEYGGLGGFGSFQKYRPQNKSRTALLSMEYGRHGSLPSSPPVQLTERFYALSTLGGGEFGNGTISILDKEKKEYVHTFSLNSTTGYGVRGPLFLYQDSSIVFYLSKVPGNHQGAFASYNPLKKEIHHLAFLPDTLEDLSSKIVEYNNDLYFFTSSITGHVYLMTFNIGSRILSIKDEILPRIGLPTEFTFHLNGELYGLSYSNAIARFDFFHYNLFTNVQDTIRTIEGENGPISGIFINQNKLGFRSNRIASSIAQNIIYIYDVNNNSFDQIDVSPSSNLGKYNIGTPLKIGVDSMLTYTGIIGTSNTLGLSVLNLSNNVYGQTMEVSSYCISSSTNGLITKVNYNGFISLGLTKQDKLNDTALLVYPNPSKTSIQIQNLAHGSRVLLRSVNGQLIDEYLYYGEEIPIAHLQNGLYILQFIGSTGEWQTSRFTKI
jgi:hypothetical protein